MRRFSPSVLSFAVAGFTCLAACSGQPPAPPPVVAQAAALPPRVVLSVTSTPDRLQLSGDRVAPQTLDVAYTIPDPKTVTEATLVLHVRGIGELATMPIPIAATGRVQFAIEPGDHSLGAVVRFRASCPSGVTEWYTMGQIPLGYPESNRDVFRIATVNPQWIPVSPPFDPRDESFEVVDITGPRLTADCRIEGEANGAAIDLKNVLFVGNRFQVWLRFRDFGSTRILHRFAELKLTVRGPGAYGAGVRLPFVEQ